MNVGQGFAQRGVIFQGLGIHHHHVDKLAGHLRGAKHFAGLWGLFDNRQLWIPGHRRPHAAGAEGRDDIGIGGIHHLDVFFLQPGFFQAAHQQIVGYRQLREIHRHSFQVAELFIHPVEDHPFVTVGVAAGDQRRTVDTARRRDRQRVHVGHRAAVKLPGGVLVDGFDVIVELNNIDFDKYVNNVIMIFEEYAKTNNIKEEELEQILSKKYDCFKCESCHKFYCYDEYSFFDEKCIYCCDTEDEEIEEF